MRAETWRDVPERVAIQVAAFGGVLYGTGAHLVRVRDRAARATALLVREALVALRRAEDAYARVCDGAAEYFAAGDAPRESQGPLERLLREVLFLESRDSGLVVGSGGFHRVRDLSTDVFVALAGILVATAGFVLVAREQHLFGQSVLLLFGLSLVPFLALGVSALRALAHELSERRAHPRNPSASRSAEKRRLRTPRKRRRRRAAA